jgi:DNA (cytosine-5)-methyltransferase 1
MLKVLETFSGIGAQAKALERLNIEYKIVATADWDINAIIAYDIIHNGKQDLSRYNHLSKEQIIELLSRYTLSPDGKEPYKNGSLSHIRFDVLKSLLCAIDRTNNLVSITDMTYKDIPIDFDLLTYSFPCQDLSIAGVWHGNMSGIDREAHNRSGMLWEVERILKECVANERPVPKFMLMENVSNILASRHMSNFQEWINYLQSIGYYNKIYHLNAKNFGIPQNRTRVYMLSVYTGNNKKIEKALEKYFGEHNLQDEEYAKTVPLKRLSVKDILRQDYSIEKYKKEADISQLNDTKSRQRIIDENDHIYEADTEEYISILKTITTKQDRNPNSGVIEYKSEKTGKLNYRYLTARECIIAMGFDEADYDALAEYNSSKNSLRDMFSEGKIIKMAGNSIVVNVLEAIFGQVDYINENIL